MLQEDFDTIEATLKLEASFFEEIITLNHFPSRVKNKPRKKHINL